MEDSSWGKFFTENIKSLTWAVGAVIAILVLVFMSLEKQNARDQKAIGAFFSAYQKTKDIKEEEKITKGIPLLDTIIEQYKGTRGAYQSMIAKGDIYYALKKYTPAIEVYKMAVEAAPDNFSKSLAFYTLATTYEMNKNYKKAIESYENTVKIKDGLFLRPEVWMAQGRCYEAINKYKEAKELYKKIQTNYKNEPYYGKAAGVLYESIKNTP